MATTVPKSKQAYLNFNQIQTYIDGGKLDAYDLIYTKDQKVLYYIDKDLNIVPIQSRLETFENIPDAIEYINNHTDTYVGKIISIFDTEEDKYIPYIINKDENDIFYVSSISDIKDDYNYDRLYNKPIINIVAEDEVVLTDLDDGFYTLVGNYRICDLDATHRMAVTKKYFVIETLLDDNNDAISHITEISGSRIYKYVCSDIEFIEDKYILASEIEDNVDEVLDREFDERADNYVATHQATEQEIIDLFSN